MSHLQTRVLSGGGSSRENRKRGRKKHFVFSFRDVQGLFSISLISLNLFSIRPSRFIIPSWTCPFWKFPCSFLYLHIEPEIKARHRHRREKKQQGTESVEDRADFISFLNLRHPEAPAKCPQSCTSSFLNFLVSLGARFPAPLLVDHTLHPGPHQD